jgi:hypothetical protein
VGLRLRLEERVSPVRFFERDVDSMLVPGSYTPTGGWFSPENAPDSEELEAECRPAPVRVERAA